MSAPSLPMWLRTKSLWIALGLFAIVPLSGLWILFVKMFLPFGPMKFDLEKLVIAAVVSVVPLFCLFGLSHVSIWQRHPYRLAVLSGVIASTLFVVVFEDSTMNQLGVVLFFVLVLTAIIGFMIHYQWLQVLLLRNPRPLPLLKEGARASLETRKRVTGLRFSLGKIFLATLLAAAALGLGRWMGLSTTLAACVPAIFPTIVAIIILPLHYYRGLHPEQGILAASLIVHSWIFWHGWVATVSVLCVDMLKQQTLFLPPPFSWLLFFTVAAVAGSIIARVVGAVVGVLLLLPIRWLYQCLEWEVVDDE